MNTKNLNPQQLKHMYVIINSFEYRIFLEKLFQDRIELQK